MSRLVLLAPLALVIAPTIAVANQCPLGNPVVDVQEVPVGCPATLLTSQRHSWPFTTPSAQTTRAGNPDPIDVTGEITRSTATYTVYEDYYETPQSCELLTRSEDEGFDVLTIELVDVVAGDRVDILDGGNTRASVDIVAAGPCPPSDAHTFNCAEPIQWCPGDGPPPPPQEDDDGGGCNTGAGAAPGGALALLGVLRRRRRK